jgi:hypothetical protein
MDSLLCSVSAYVCMSSALPGQLIQSRMTQNIIYVLNPVLLITFPSDARVKDDPIP